MKLFFATTFLLFSSATFAQSAQNEQAAAPGCGTTDTKFDVKTAKAQHPIAKPDPGKALVYFLQDDTDFLSRPRPSTRFGIDGNWIGATNSNSYFYFSIDPGEHHLCAGWQSFVGFTTGQKSAAAHFTAEAGNSYFFLVRNRALEDHGPAGMKFAPVDSDEAQLLMSKFALSTSHPRK